jgi:hypothetical protein
MNAKKFLVVMLVIGLIKICYASPQPIVKSVLQFPQAQQISIYPCLLSPGSQAHSNNNCLSELLQGGLGLKFIF